MFVKLTRIDGRPVWVNGIFVVTVEPARGGGSLVVPMGDGMDYEVRESPETVLGLLQGAPAPAVIAVPAPTGLTHLPPDAVPDDPGALVRGGDSADVSVPDPVPAAPAAETPPKRRRTTRKTAVAKEIAETATSKEDAAKPVKATARRTSTRKKAAAAKTPAETAAETAVAAPSAPLETSMPAPAPAPAPEPATITVTPLTAADDLVSSCAAQAKRSGCRTENRMVNFLKSTNRRVPEKDILAAVAEMKRRGLVLVDAQGRVTFQ